MAAPIIIKAGEQDTGDALPYTLAPEAAVIVMDDGNGCILDMDGEFYAISEIGTSMLRTTLDAGPEAAVIEIANRYQANRAQVQADLDALLRSLAAKGIIHAPDGSQKRQKGRTGATIIAAFATALFAVFRGKRTKATIALALARVSFGLFGWTATVAAWQSRWPQPESSDSEGTFDHEGHAGKIDQIDLIVRRKAARMWLDVDCKERALTCMSLARQSGLPATVVIGVEFYPLGGHCWCEIGDRVVSDDPGNCARYLPVFRYG